MLTTRELARMIRAEAIDPSAVPESDTTSPLGEYTGAGVIFGATGGVMEAALRTAYQTGDRAKTLARTCSAMVRGMKPWKEAEL